LVVVCSVVETRKAHARRDAARCGEYRQAAGPAENVDAAPMVCRSELSLLWLAPQLGQAGDLPFAAPSITLSAGCPAYVQPHRWQQCVADARRFVPTLGKAGGSARMDDRYATVTGRATGGGIGHAVKSSPSGPSAGLLAFQSQKPLKQRKRWPRIHGPFANTGLDS
jgi:hypothetical protein